MRAIILAAAAFAFASSAHAFLPDPNEHPRSAHAQKVEWRPAHRCTKGKKLCGHTCITKSRVCHKTLDPQSGLPTGQRLHKPS